METGQTAKLNSNSLFFEIIKMEKKLETCLERQIKRSRQILADDTKMLFE
jgi:hypothetical protein